MAIFLFLIGLEIKRELMEGELSSPSQIALPGAGALGGMIIPAAIYAWFNWSNAAALDGWAIPVATDIAFALALLSVFESRVPIALKVFLLTLAISDDLAAIIIIAIFYSSDLSINALLVGATVLAIAAIMNRLGVTRVSVYILLGIVLWVAVLKSGVHATLAGVLIALCIPMRDKSNRSPLRELEHDLHGPVAFAILPIFAFANSGLSLSGMSIDDLTHPVTIGVISGLLIGKPLGILLFVGLASAFRLVALPNGVTWTQILGVAFACGIGFTMSLFIAGLALEHGSGDFFWSRSTRHTRGLSPIRNRCIRAIAFQSPTFISKTPLNAVNTRLDCLAKLIVDFSVFLSSYNHLKALIFRDVDECEPAGIVIDVPNPE